MLQCGMIGVAVPQTKAWQQDDMERAASTIPAPRPRPRALAAIALLIACAAILMLGGAGRPGQASGGAIGTGVALREPLRAGLVRIPLPEPLVFAPMGPDRARMLNAQIPFAASIGSPAKPFTLSGGVESRERAIDCLASAMWYEAGDDARGQRAVGQVVLNRVRHPAFPASICGVVFEGSDRQTGCQFTFTCDGAMKRIPPEGAFARARGVARAMLDGKVDPEVGLATHYHTDWVHPVWSTAMDKLARVETHLFFRWRGKWGGAAAMAQGYGGVEPNIPALSGLSPVHRGEAPDGVAMSPVLAAVSKPVSIPFAETPQVSAPPPAAKPANTYALSVAPQGSAAAPALAALEMCGDKSFCKVVGNLPASSAPAFLYVRDRRTGVEKTYWDCGAFPRKDAAQCLSPGNRWLAFEGNLQSGGA